MKYLKMLVYLLVIVGAANWGMIGVFKLDLVAAVFGDMTIPTRLVYSLVGLSALLSLIFAAFEKKNECNCM